MSDLTEFLSARIGEDKAVARKATPGPWWNESGTVHAPFPFGRDLNAGPGGACHPLDAQGGNGRDADADAEHAARHDPTRVLAECEAKRRIVKDIVSNDYVTSPAVTDGLSVRVLEYLALPYAAHPDYREEWRS